MTEEGILVCLIYGVPIIFGYVIPTIIDKLIKDYKEKHKCQHKHTFWQKKPETSMFSCISGDTMIQVCKDCGQVINESFWEYEGMGYK